jgi:predicted flap endonuclease-1-like 5' DNA nuclease
MAVISRESFVIENDQTRKGKGPLVKVQIGPGQYRKMYQADAIKAGLLPAPVPSQPPKDDRKDRPATGNKVRLPERDKGVSVETVPSISVVPASERDDLTAIPGLGKATARLLGVRGVATLAQLRIALQSGALGDFGLSPSVVAAIEAWAEGKQA